MTMIFKGSLKGDKIQSDRPAILSVFLGNIDGQGFGFAVTWSAEFQERVVDRLGAAERTTMKAQIIEVVQDTLNRQMPTIVP